MPDAILRALHLLTLWVLTTLWGKVIVPIYGWRRWGTERISDIPKATQLAHDQVEIWIQTIMNSRVHASNLYHASHRDKHPVYLASRGLALGWTLVFLERQLSREQCLSLGYECGPQAGEHAQVTSLPWVSLSSLGDGGVSAGAAVQLERILNVLLTACPSHTFTHPALNTHSHAPPHSVHIPHTSLYIHIIFFFLIIWYYYFYLFWGAFILVSVVAAVIHTPTNNAHGFPLLDSTSSPHLLPLVFFLIKIFHSYTILLSICSYFALLALFLVLYNNISLWCWSWSTNILATWWEEPTHWKRPLCWERLKAGGEEGDKGWDGWMASLTQWTWVWANSGR